MANFLDNIFDDFGLDDLINVGHRSSAPRWDRMRLAMPPLHRRKAQTIRPHYSANSTTKIVPI